MSIIDITARIGEFLPIQTMDNPPDWPMYSFDRPSRILWNALANGLAERGWTEDQIRKWLQSKSARYALDSDLGDALRDLGHAYASKV